MKNKYIFETNDKNEMELVVNKDKIYLALCELKKWYREVLNGKDYDYKLLVQGKIITPEEHNSLDFSKRKDLKRDEHGFLIDCKTIYYREDIADKIETILDGLWDLIDD